MIIVEIAGNLGADPEERFTSNGKRVVTLRVAARVRKGGQDDTVWWRVSIWDDRFDKMLPHLKKGSSVIVIGEMAKPEIYTGRDGTQQISMNMNADILKFSPFGRPAAERSGESQGHSANSTSEDPFTSVPRASHGGQFEYATAGNGQNDLSAGDDLPF